MKSLRRIPGFTLVELLVVIALISLLLAVMVPVIIAFMRGRGLKMAANSIGGFLAFSRTEALNSRQPHVLVFLTEETTFQNPGETFPTKIGPGIALFRCNSNPEKSNEAVVLVKEYNLSDQLSDDVDFAAKWKRKAEGTAAPVKGLGDQADAQINNQFAKRYKIVIRVDGRSEVIDDKPGYLLEVGANSTKGPPDADLVLQDSSRFVFIDINPATTTIRASDTIQQEDSQYK